MPEVRWSKFRDKLGYYFDKGESVTVNYKGYKYMTVSFHDRKEEYFKKDGDVLIDDLGMRFRECRICGSLYHVRYIVPYDGAMEPGAYCYRCRKKYSLMDVKDAKRYGKIL